MSKLAVFPILTVAFRTIWTERGDFIRIAAIPIVALAFSFIALQVFQLSALFDGEVTMPAEPTVQDAHEMARWLLEEKSGFFFAALLFMFAGFVIVSIFSCAWHYRVLRPNESRTVWEGLKWDAAKGRFITMAILLGIIQLIAQFCASVAVWLVGSVLLTAMPGMAEIILPLLVSAPYIIAIYLMLRLALVLPASAVGDNLSLQDSWTMTKGNGLALVILAMFVFLGLVLAMIAVFIPVSTFLGVLALITPGLLTLMFIMQLIMCTLFIVGTAVWVAALSMVYRQLSGATASV